MKNLICLLPLIFFISCSDKSAHPIEMNNKDSALSQIMLIGKGQDEFFDTEIKNITYSIKKFKLNRVREKYICKTTSIDRISYDTRAFYSEKKEFFDQNFVKIFEIKAINRKIKIQDYFYITHDMIKGISGYFELFNYGEKEPFVKCTGLLWTVEIPESEMKGYFGYRKFDGSEFNSYPVLGTIYYSINRIDNYKLIIKAADEDTYKAVSHIMGITLKPNNPLDKYNGNSNLYLWSKKGNSDIKGLTDFSLVITAGIRLSDDDINNNEIKKYTIPIIDGKIFGKDDNQGTYEYVISI